MMPTSVQAADDARGSARSSIYLAAALYSDGSRSSVKIRNISATGALVEGPTIPSAGTLVQLVRGSLIVHGIVAWAADDRCGLRFSGSVDVQQWRGAPTNNEQQRVDDVVRLVKAGAVPLPVGALAATSALKGPDDFGTELSSDLRRAFALLHNLGEVLGSDPDTVNRNGPALQNLDIAMQMIAAVQAMITGQSDFEADATKLTGLRISADQALRQG